MATRYELRTFGDIISAIMETAKIQSSDTVSRNRIKRNINSVYLDEIIPAKEWSWRRSTITLQHQPYFSTGTVSVTAGSIALTLSETPTLSYKGYLFAVEGFNEIYRITSHSANSSSVLIDMPFGGQTSSAASFKIWKDTIPLPPDAEEAIEITHQWRDRPMDKVGTQEFRRLTATNPKGEGRPAAYTTTDWKDPDPYTAISGMPSSLTRASSGLVKTIVFNASLGSTTANLLLKPGDKIELSAAGHYTYNIPAVVGSISSTTLTNDTLTYTALLPYDESATSDTTIVVKKLSGESFEAYRELQIYPSIFNTRTTIQVDYLKAPLPLEADDDEPIIPIKDRIVLYYGALAMTWTRERNPEEKADADLKYERKLQRMMGNTENTPDKPQISVSRYYLNAKRMTQRPRMHGGAVGSSGSGSTQSPSGTPDRAAVFNSAGYLSSDTNISTTELGYLNGVTSNIQDQLDGLGLVDPVANNRVLYSSGDAIIEGDITYDGELLYLDNVEKLTTVTLSDDTTDDIATWDYATYDSIIITYSIKRGSANKAVGTITLCTDGSEVGISQSGSDLGTLGVTLSADIDGSNIRLRYTTDASGTDATFKYKLHKWLA
jgi:hypothetical protein